MSKDKYISTLKDLSQNLSESQNLSKSQELSRKLWMSWSLSRVLWLWQSRPQELELMNNLSKSHKLSQQLEISPEISQEISQYLNRTSWLVKIMLEEVEDFKQPRKGSKQNNNAYTKNCAAKLLPMIASLLDDSSQADLVELRERWYGDRLLNWWTHSDVLLKTYYEIFHGFRVWLWDKITSRPLYRKRIYRVKDSE